MPLPFIPIPTSQVPGWYVCFTLVLLLYIYELSPFQSLLFVLRESHKVRIAFRKAGGFLYCMSTLVTLEGTLAPCAKPPWDSGEAFTCFFALLALFPPALVPLKFLFRVFVGIRMYGCCFFAYSILMRLLQSLFQVII